MSPFTPIVAMNAKASITPPNWANTLDAESTTVRSGPSGLVPRRAKHTIAPTTAPTTAVTAAIQSELPNPLRIFGSTRALRFARVA